MRMIIIYKTGSTTGVPCAPRQHDRKGGAAAMPSPDASLTHSLHRGQIDSLNSYLTDR
ncbi:hypothetical protein BCEP4_1470023 [Burkholderia cepacia]|nr:hypothetical protein BCEP4_1470023 [Burkholderia cepacia]